MATIHRWCRPAMFFSSICNLQELDDMLREYDMKRDSVEINHNAPNGLTTQCGTENIWNRRQDTHCGNFGLTPSRPLAEIFPSYEVKDGDIRRAVAAIADLPSSTLPDSPFILALGTPAAQTSHRKLAP